MHSMSCCWFGNSEPGSRIAKRKVALDERQWLDVTACFSVNIAYIGKTHPTLLIHLYFETNVCR